MTDLSRNKEFSDKPKNTTTEMRDVMKALALTQLSEFVSRDIFKELGLESIVFDMSVMRLADPNSIAKGLRQDIERMKAKFGSLDQPDFEKDFDLLFSNKMKELEPVWDEKWRELCNGKQLFEDMRRSGHLKGDLLKIKKAIMTKMRAEKTETYNSLENLLRELVEVE
jgi:hypothetical protein